MSEKVVIVGAVRTPIGSFCGSLSTLSASDLGSVVIKEVLKRAKIPPEDVNEVIMGQTFMTLEGQNPARQAAMKANVPIAVPSYTVNYLCGSGLKTVTLGYQSIKCGDSKIVVCGGQECMSNAPHAIHLRTPVRCGDTKMVDTLLRDGLTDVFHNIHMGKTAENIAKQKNISRLEQDELAFKSQQRTEIAKSSGFFNDEIVPVIIETKKGPVTVDSDEFPKPATTVEILSKLPPVFEKDGTGTVTVGNSSGMNDGAAAVVLTTEAEAKSRGLPVMAEIVGWSHAGVEPAVMGLGPVPAVQSLLAKVGWTKDDVDIYELNEAFAAQSIGVIRDLGLSEDKVNTCGGAISLGHPLGSSGARVLVTLLYILRRLGKSKGVASLCIGGGQGIAIAVQVPA